MCKTVNTPWIARADCIATVLVYQKLLKLKMKHIQDSTVQYYNYIVEGEIGKWKRWDIPV